MRTLAKTTSIALLLATLLISCVQMHSNPKEEDLDPTLDGVHEGIPEMTNAEFVGLCTNMSDLGSCPTGSIYLQEIQKIKAKLLEIYDDYQLTSDDGKLNRIALLIYKGRTDNSYDMIQARAEIFTDIC